MYRRFRWALALTLGAGLAMVVSCKQTKTSTNAPPDPLLPNTLTPTATPVKNSPVESTNAPGK